MSLFLDQDALPEHAAFSGDTATLRAGLQGELARLEEQLEAYQGEQLLVIVTGHPCVGKSTLIRALNALELPEGVGVFHVDDHIDWEKVVKAVDGEPDRYGTHYMEAGNRAAMNQASEKFAEAKILVFEGGGSIEAYQEIAREAGFPNPHFVVVDAEPGLCRERLAKRGDGLELTEEHATERRENLAAIETVEGLRIETDAMEKDNPVEQLEQFLSSVSVVLSRRMGV
jgi:energy-coupling factor transporter ATP-binding protein EcfA2